MIIFTIIANQFHIKLFLKPIVSFYILPDVLYEISYIKDLRNLWNIVFVTENVRSLIAFIRNLGLLEL